MNRDAAPLPIVVTGAAGRMGRTLIDEIARVPSLRLVGATERPDHPALGNDAGAGTGVPIRADLAAVLPAGAVVIDFTSLTATLVHVAACERVGAAAVIGTTGLGEAERAELRRYAAKVPIVCSPNMSVGVNVLFGLVATAARALGEDYDVEIVEAHHHGKRDAPSGTAVRLVERVAEALGRDPVRDVAHGRVGGDVPRTPREIGVHALRGGDIVGEHRVLFAGRGERVELAHQATDRAIFARGALRAAGWLRGRAPGLYDMSDVLGLSAAR